MARKQVSIQDTVETNEDFENYLNEHAHQLICMEVYSEFCGYCLATGNAVRKGKLEIGEDRISMVKAQADNIDALERFRYKSEPVFLFIQNHKLTHAMFGANGIRLCEIIESELKAIADEEKGVGIERKKYDITQRLPEEAEKMQEELKIEQECYEAEHRLQVLTQAARKKRVCERLSVHVQRYNYILFWPHCHQAHYDLYEKWDYVNIQVAAKEFVVITEEAAKEVLYMSDVEPNEACLYALVSGEALVVLFKMFDTDDRDFVKVLRHALYEEIPENKEDEPPEKQKPPIPAYERYATISKTAREVRRDRYNAKLEKLRQEQEERERLAREQARLAREAEEERQREEKQRKEDERMARLAAGLPADPEPEELPPPEGEEALEGDDAEGTNTEAPTEAPTDVTEATDEPQAQEEEKVEEEEEFHSDVSVEGEEYIPPGGLFVPGLYCPPNELAKANGLTFFFPKVVSKLTEIESEVLPPHMLLIFTMDKREEIREIMEQLPGEILNYGVFIGEDLATFEHVAYTLKQYSKMDRRFLKHKDRLALMVSRKRSLPLLQLAGLNPIYISSDTREGERDCLQLFPVGYGDDYEEVESVVEVEVEAPPPVSQTAVVPEPTVEKTEDDEDEDDEIEG